MDKMTMDYPEFSPEELGTSVALAKGMVSAAASEIFRELLQDPAIYKALKKNTPDQLYRLEQALGRAALRGMMRAECPLLDLRISFREPAENIHTTSDFKQVAQFALDATEPEDNAR